MTSPLQEAATSAELRRLCEGSSATYLAYHSHRTATASLACTSEGLFIFPVPYDVVMDLLWQAFGLLGPALLESSGKGSLSGWVRHQTSTAYNDLNSRSRMSSGTRQLAEMLAEAGHEFLWAHNPLTAGLHRVRVVAATKPIRLLVELPERFARDVAQAAWQRVAQDAGVVAMVQAIHAQWDQG